MYKDKNKQREANRKAQAKRRSEALGFVREAPGHCGSGMTKGMTDDCAKAGIVIPDHPVPVIPSSKRGKDIKCFADLPPDVQGRINRMKTGSKFKEREAANEIAYQQFITSGKPGDDDYNGVCTPEWRAERGR